MEHLKFTGEELRHVEIATVHVAKQVSNIQANNEKQLHFVEKSAAIAEGHTKFCFYEKIFSVSSKVSHLPHITIYDVNNGVRR